MSINTKTKAAVDTLLTDDATTEAQFKTGLQDVTSEVDSLNTGTVKTTTSFTGDVSGTYNATVVANDSHTHDTRYYTETEINNMFSGATDKTGYNNDNWDASYGWGDHGLEGKSRSISGIVVQVKFCFASRNQSRLESYFAKSKSTSKALLKTSWSLIY